ncbi:MAG: lamin tail domain-containing protein, partial [Candidatus Blackburnbacteria bacterium]|nr:lamin tail domain-containing protein [Candidatus Blackburnbacteria bacterium]
MPKLLPVISLLTFFFLLFSNTVAAATTDIIINEIMYDLPGSDTDREWIEIYNKGSSSIDLTNWRFQEGSTKHTLNSYQGGMILGPGNYAVIIDNPTGFLGDHGGFSGMIIDSSFSLSNTGENLGLLEGVDAVSLSDEVSYQSAWGAAGNGGSLERKSETASSSDSNNWQESVAGGTPGVANSSGVAPTPTPAPTASPSPMPTPAATPTPTPTASSTPTPSSSPTATPKPTTTASSTPRTATSSPTPTGTPKTTTAATTPTSESLVLGVTDVSSPSGGTQESATAGAGTK